MGKRKNENSKAFDNYTAVELNAIYARARRKFSAADLQKYTVIEKGVPLEQVITEMEAIHKKHKRKKA